jgi:membrane associated rhomboid family serine protease
MLFPVEYRVLRADRMPWLSFGVMLLWVLALGTAALGWPDGDTLHGLQRGAITPFTFATHWLWHESWAHALASLTLLLFIGPALEEAWGWPVFGALCVLGIGITAGAQLVAPGDPARPLVGASGLVALLLSACIVRFRNEGLYFTAVGWWKDWVHTRFWLPSYALIVGWFAFEVAMQAVGDGLGATRGVSYTGPIVGAVLGAGLGFAMPAYGWEERFKPARADSPAIALELARLAVASEEPKVALDALDTALQVHPDDDALVSRFCEIAIEAEHPERARSRFELRLRSCAKSADFDEAAALWRRFVPTLGRPELPTRARLALAESLRDAAPEEAARLLKAALGAPNPTMGLALRIADLARPVHAGVAADAARQALAAGGDELPDAKRIRLEQLIEEMDAERASLPEVDLSEEPLPQTTEVADPNERSLDDTEPLVDTGVELASGQPEDRSLELGFEDDDLSAPPAGFSSTTADTPELTEPEPASVWELDDRRSETPPGDGPLALDLDGSLDDGDSEPLASEDYVEPANPVPAETDSGPDTLPHLGSVGGPRPAEAVATAPTLPPTQIDILDSPPDPLTAEVEPGIESITLDEIEAALADSDLGSEIAAPLPRFSNVKRVVVTPTAWESERLALRQSTETSAWLALSKVEAIAVAAIEGLAARPVLVIDLLMHWNDVSEDTTLHVVRLRSDRFEPSAILPTARPGPDGFRDVLKGLLTQSGATPLPDANSAMGDPFARFVGLDAYEREVLQLDV